LTAHFSWRVATHPQDPIDTRAVILPLTATLAAHRQ
jgi:hypothetical protein